MPQFKRVVHSFMAGPAARITGRSIENQKNDVRGNFAPYAEKRGGKNFYDVHSLAAMMVMQVLADRGIGPIEGSKIADRLKTQVAWWALSYPGAIVDQTGEFFDFYKERGWDPASHFIYGSERFVYFKYFVLWPDGTESLSDTVAELLTEAQYKVQFDTDQFLNLPPPRPMLSGAVVILDLEIIGKTLAHRANGRLATIEKPLTEQERQELSDMLDEQLKAEQAAKQ